MAKMPTAQKRLLIAFIISAPTLLGVYWLVQNGARNMAAALFFMLFLADFLVLKRRPVPSTGAPVAKTRVRSGAVWVVGVACCLGSLSHLSSGVRTHDTWEIVLASFGMLASGLGVAYFAAQE